MSSMFRGRFGEDGRVPARHAVQQLCTATHARNGHMDSRQHTPQAALLGHEQGRAHSLHPDGQVQARSRALKPRVTN